MSRNVILFLLTLSSLMTAQERSSLAMDKGLSAEQKAAVMSGKLPLVWFEWKEEMDPAFEPGGDRSFLDAYSNLREYFTFYRGDGEVSPSGLHHYIGFPNHEGDNPNSEEWLSPYIYSDGSESVPDPQTSITPVFTYVGFGAGFIGGMLWATDFEARGRATNPDFDATAITTPIAVGLTFLGAGAGFLLDAIFQAPGNMAREREYRAKVEELQRNAPPRRKIFPENIGNLSALEERILQYNQSILNEPKFGILLLKSGTTMGEVVAAFGEPDNLESNSSVIKAKYMLSLNNTAVLEYTLGGILLKVELD